MRVLIAEDDFASRKFMRKTLSRFGECDVTVDGIEAVEAYKMALEEGMPYNLVCLDIMMPVFDGYQALKAIREFEEEKNLPEEEKAKIIMTTALNEKKNVDEAFDLGCIAYASKPIDIDRFERVLQKLELID